MTAQSSMSSSDVATWLARLGRQLFLVPEAVVLLALLSMYRGWGANLSLAILVLFVTLWFGLRMSLLFIARRAFERGEYARADVLAQWAVSLYPYSADALALLGMTHLANGQVRQAVNSLQRAVTYYPWQPGLHTALATALLEAGQTRAARTAAQQALKLDPMYGPACLPLAEAEAKLGSADAVVEGLIRQGLQGQLTPVDAAALQCALAACLIRKSVPAEAQQALSAAAALLVDVPPMQRAGLHFQLGELWQMLDDRDAARSHFAASADLDPQGPHAAAAWRAART